MYTYIHMYIHKADLPLHERSLPATATLDLERLHVILTALVREKLQDKQNTIHVHVHVCYYIHNPFSVRYIYTCTTNMPLIDALDLYNAHVHV